MGLRERFRLEEIEGDSLLYVPPVSLIEKNKKEEKEEDEESKVEKEAKSSDTN